MRTGGGFGGGCLFSQSVHLRFEASADSIIFTVKVKHLEVRQFCKSGFPVAHKTSQNMSVIAFCYSFLFSSRKYTAVRRAGQTSPGHSLTSWAHLGGRGKQVQAILSLLGPILGGGLGPSWGTGQTNPCHALTSWAHLGGRGKQGEKRLQELSLLHMCTFDKSAQSCFSPPSVWGC